MEDKCVNAGNHCILLIDSAELDDGLVLPMGNPSNLLREAGNLIDTLDGAEFLKVEG